MEKDEQLRPRPATRREVQLRAFCGDDCEFFTSLATDPRVVAFVGDGRPWPSERIDERVREALRDVPASEDGAVRWFIAEDSGESVGLFVSARHGDAVEIGYWVAPEVWGQGVAGTMLDAGIRTVAAVFGPGTLVARIDPANVASARLVQRRGFHHERRVQGLDRYVRSM